MKISNAILIYIISTGWLYLILDKFIGMLFACHFMSILLFLLAKHEENKQQGVKRT